MQYHEDYKPWAAPLNAKAMINYTGWQNDKRHRVVVFDSGDDLAQCANTNLACMGGNGSWSNESEVATNRDRRDEWKFGELNDLKTTEGLISNGIIPTGWLDRVDKMRDKLFHDFPELHDLNAVAIASRRRRVYNDNDGELDLDRYMSADPAMWGKMTKTNMRHRVAKILVDVSVSCGTSTETFVNNFIQALAVIDIVERSGIATEIVVSATGRNSTSDTKLYSVCVVAKHATERLDIQRLLSFAAPGFFRHYVFGVWTNLLDQGAKPDWGLGCPTQNRDEVPMKFFGSQIVIKGMDEYWAKNQLKIIVQEIDNLFEVKKVLGRME